MSPAWIRAEGAYLRVMADLRLFFHPPVVADRGLRLHGVGIREWMPPCIIDRPGGTDDWLLMTWHRPVLLRADAGAPPTLHPGPVTVVWDRAHGHYYGREDRRWCHSWIHADGAWLAERVAADGLPRNRPLVGTDPAWIESCARDLHAEARGGHEPDPDLLRHRLAILLRQLARHARAGAPTIPPDWLTIRGEIEARCCERLRLDALARRLGVSAGHFCEQFRRHFGVSPYRLAVGLRLERARVLLRDRSLTIAEVAAEVGYDDPRQFARLFRRHHGSAPGRAR